MKMRSRLDKFQTLHINLYSGELDYQYESSYLIVADFILRVLASGGTDAPSGSCQIQCGVADRWHQRHWDQYLYLSRVGPLLGASGVL